MKERFVNLLAILMVSVSVVGSSLPAALLTTHKVAALEVETSQNDNQSHSGKNSDDPDKPTLPDNPIMGR